MSVERMRFHGPGWTLTRPADGFQLWAPQADVIRDENRFPGMWSTGDGTWHEDARQPRDHWAASWHELTDEDEEPDPFHPGGFWKGSSADEVLAHFPSAIRGQFQKALTDA